MFFYERCFSNKKEVNEESRDMFFYERYEGWNLRISESPFRNKKKVNEESRDMFFYERWNLRISESDMFCKWGFQEFMGEQGTRRR